MAEKPIRFEFVAEVAQYLRETKKLAVSTEDIADALLNVSNESGDLEKKLARAMREAEKDTESLSRALKDLPKATDGAAKDIARDFDKIGDEAKEAGKEAGRNLGQSLGEGLSSGDLGGVLQEVLGETLGEVSGPVGAAVAVGAGIALAVWNAFAEQSRIEKQKLNEMLDITDELTGSLDRVAQVRLALEELGGGDYGQGLLDAKKYADALGISIGDITNLISGDMNPAAEATKFLLEDQKRVLENTLELQQGDLSDADQARLDAINEILGTTKLQVAAVEAAAAAQDTWNAASRESVENSRHLKEYLEASEQAANGVPGAMEKAAYWARIVAYEAKAAEDAWQNARDYAAGTGGTMPRVGVGPNKAV